jgi:hypothetical protein
MTPIQLAKAECANFDNGRCLGIGIRDNGSLYGFEAKGPCVLKVLGVRCPYFEECVLPMASRVEPPTRRTDYMEAAAFYRRAANVPQSVSRTCSCGRPLEPYKQTCYVCRDAARKQKNRQRNQKRKSKGLSTPQS